MSFPAEIQINAWDGAEVRGALDPGLESRILGLPLRARSRILPAAPVPQTEWRDPSVGWGLVLPDNTGMSPAERARVDDAPEPVRRLVAARDNAPVFRVGDDWQPGFLRRYFADGSPMDARIGASLIGTAEGRIPRYLLIVGDPTQIPWEVQFDLQVSHFVGRLDLDETGLDHYVTALLADWGGASATPAHTLCWSVDHGSHDITRLMQNTIGKPLFDRFATDTDPALVAGAKLIAGSQATHAELIAAVASHRPSLIATTSHGATSPLTDTPAMAARLGLLIDDNHDVLDPLQLTGDHAPDGSIWYAHACCSAGSAGVSGFDGLLTAGSRADKVLKAVAQCGSLTAPLPAALLGAVKPLKAFVGHVEPTFDWSIRHPETGQFLTNPLLQMLHQMLFTGYPIGMAMDSVRETGAAFLNSYDVARRKLIEDRDEAVLGPLLALHLAARDWQSIVLLGDPTCTVYPPKP